MAAIIRYLIATLLELQAQSAEVEGSTKVQRTLRSLGVLKIFVLKLIAAVSQRGLCRPQPADSPEPFA